MARTDETYSGVGYRPHRGVSPEDQRRTVESNPRWQQQAAKEREATERLKGVLAEQMPLLGVDQTPDQILYGHGPGYGPDAAIRQIEQRFGRFDDVPGWANHTQFAQAGAAQAAEASSSAQDESSRQRIALDEYRRNGYLLTPDQIAYLQVAGRPIHLLSSLRSKEKPSVGPSMSEIFGWMGVPRHHGASQVAPDFGMRLWDGYAGHISQPTPLNAYRAMYWWDRSDEGKNPDAIRSHDSLGSPVYGLFSGVGQNAVSELNDPLNPFSRYLQVAAIPWNAVKFAMTDDDPRGALDYSGLTGVLNGLSKAYTLFKQQGRQRPSTGSSVLDMAPLPEGASESEEAAYEQAYRQRKGQLAGMMADIAPPSMQEILPGASPAVGDLVETLGSALDPSLAAGATAGILAKRAAGMTAARAARREAVEQMAPEFAIGGGLTYGLSGNERSWLDYFLRASGPADVDRGARADAHRKAEVMAPQSMWQAREEAAKALRLTGW